MPPIPNSSHTLPRLITYYQTHHTPSGEPISVLPLLTQPSISITHLILAAIHINEDPQALTLNDQHPDHQRFHTLWAEMRVCQAMGVRVLGMLGGAAPGTYTRLDGDDAQFERYYTPVRDLIRNRALDGIDLDVEEQMSLAGIIRLIDRLRTDFGPSFIITLAPVAAALLSPENNLSGFDYEALEVMRGREIAWYNTQFYCGWGDARTPIMYDYMIRKGWNPEKVVVGLVTNPANGAGFVEMEALAQVFAVLKGRYRNFGGVMGWEYFNSWPGDTNKPWEWARTLSVMLRQHVLDALKAPVEATADTAPATKAKRLEEMAIDPDAPEAKTLQTPEQFEYFTDGNNDA